MEILNSLGLNETAFIQFGIFLVAFFFISNLLFKPYLAAFIEREKSTVGNEEEALLATEESKKVSGLYEQRARRLNDKINQFFDHSRAEAERESDLILKKARHEAEVYLQEYRNKIESQTSEVKHSLSKEIPAISSGITGKLLGKEIQA